MSRADDWNRISAMAGLDADGGILPPPAGMTLDRSPSPYWRTHARRAPHTHAPARDQGGLPGWTVDDIAQAEIEGFTPDRYYLQPDYCEGRA